MEEADSWLSDRKPLLTSEDHGKDESSTAALLQRHLRVEKEMVAYGPEIKRLSEQAKSVAQLTYLTVSTHYAEVYSDLLTLPRLHQTVVRFLTQIYDNVFKGQVHHLL